MSEQRISPRKLKVVEELVNDLQSYRTIGLIVMRSIGAKTVQKLRAELRGRAKIKLAKNTLMRKALEQVDIKGADVLAKEVQGPVAFLFTNDSPYQIANYLEKNKVAAPAKAGQIAPKTVTIPKMNTGFPPGTIISELNSVGLPTRIEQGTVAISQDTVVVEKGEKVSTTLASILSQLGIEPFEVGLSVELVLDEGEILYHDDLLIDFEAYYSQLLQAHRHAVSLSVKSAFITEDTGSVVIASAQREALALAAAIGYITKDTAVQVIGRARSNAIALLRAVLEVDSTAIPEDIAALASTPVVASASPVSKEVAEEEEEEEEEEVEGEVVEEDDFSLF